MVRPIVVFLTLAVAVTATDHHHYQGMAVVTYQGEIWQAAFRMEDFDPVHTPELQLQTLQRITLTPVDGKERVSQRTTQQVRYSALPQSNGHALFQIGPFTIDATPVEADVRSDFASYSTMVQPGKDYTTQKELIIIPGSKAELNSDGEPGRDTLTLVVYSPWRTVIRPAEP